MSCNRLGWSYLHNLPIRAGHRTRRSGGSIDVRTTPTLRAVPESRCHDRFGPNH